MTTPTGPFSEFTLFDYSSYYSDIARRLPGTSNVVELGAGYGRSGAFLAKKCQTHGKRASVTLIDNLSYDGERQRQQILDYASTEGVAASINLLVGNSASLANRFEDGSLDFIFIDADHGYHGVRADICAWSRKLKRPTGILAGHDFHYRVPGSHVWLAVETHYPPAQIKVIPTDEGYGVWERINDPLPYGSFSKPFEASIGDLMIFIPFARGIDRLRSTVSSLGKWKSNLILVNQSGHDITEHFPGIAVYEMDGGMYFTKAQNAAQSIARSLGAKYLIFLHYDCTAPETAIEFLLDSITQRKPGWGAIFASYDALSLFSMECLESVGCWDETFRWYVADIDYYRRMEREGWRIDPVEIPGVIHAGSQTLRSLSEPESQTVHADHQWAWEHYLHKWGARPQGERYTIPYDGNP